VISVKDDALGENLQVIREGEPVAKIIEKNTLAVLVGFDSRQPPDIVLNEEDWGTRRGGLPCDRPLLVFHRWSSARAIKARKNSDFSCSFWP